MRRYSDDANRKVFEVASFRLWNFAYFLPDELHCGGDGLVEELQGSDNFLSVLNVIGDFIHGRFGGSRSGSQLGNHRFRTCLPVGQFLVDQVVDFALETTRTELRFRSPRIVSSITKVHKQHLSRPLRVMQGLESGVNLIVSHGGLSFRWSGFIQFVVNTFEMHAFFIDALDGLETRGLLLHGFQQFTVSPGQSLVDFFG